MKQSMIDKILTEWSYRVHDGMPNPKNPLHLVHLRESLEHLNMDGEVIDLMMNKLYEDTDDKYVSIGYGRYKEKGKEKDPDAPTFTKDDRGNYIPTKKDTDKEKEKSKEPEEKPEAPSKPKIVEPMDNPFDKEKETGKHLDQMAGDDEESMDDLMGQMDDEEGSSEEQSQKEKNKREYLSKIADLFVGANSEEKGHGRFRLSKQDVKQYQEHLAKSTEQILKEQEAREQEREQKYGKITPEDTEVVLEIIKSKVDSKQWNSLKSRIKKKGDPPGEYSKGERGTQRVNLVIQHYLMTGGISSITGKSVPFSDSQLDHVISLDNGGKDGPENWEWMESRFNQFKGKRTEPEVIEALKERGMRTDAEWLLEASEDELKNFEGESTVAYWNTVFADTDEDNNPGLGNLTVEKIDNMTSSELDSLAKGWGRFVGERDPRFIPRYGTRKTEIDGKRLPYSRGGDVKPDKNNPNSWGVSTDNMGLTWSVPKYKDDPDGYGRALADYEKSRASGGAKITTTEVREMIKVKITGIPTKSESDEIDVMFESIIGQVESDKSKIKDLKQIIKKQKAEK